MRKAVDPETGGRAIHANLHLMLRALPETIAAACISFWKLSVYIQTDLSVHFTPMGDGCSESKLARYATPG